MELEIIAPLNNNHNSICRKEKEVQIDWVQLHLQCVFGPTLEEKSIIRNYNDALSLLDKVQN